MSPFLAYVKNKGTETIRAVVAPCLLLLAAATSCVVAQEPATVPPTDAASDAEPNVDEPNVDAADKLRPHALRVDRRRKGRGQGKRLFDRIPRRRLPLRVETRRFVRFSNPRGNF